MTSKKHFLLLAFLFFNVRMLLPLSPKPQYLLIIIRLLSCNWKGICKDFIYTLADVLLAFKMQVLKQAVDYWLDLLLFILLHWVHLRLQHHQLLFVWLNLCGRVFIFLKATCFFGGIPLPFKCIHLSVDTFFAHTLLILSVNIVFT